MDSYVVRIYRNAPSRRDPLVGVVIDVRRHREYTFHNSDELAAIFSKHAAPLEPNDKPSRP